VRRPVRQHRARGSGARHDRGAVRPGRHQDARSPINVADRLTLTATPTGSAEIAVIDAQRLDQLDIQLAGLLLVALRGPCYLGLRTITTTSAVRADGIVLLAEPGRSLTRRDVSDVCDVPVMAEIAVTANVARTIDAGLLVTRLQQLREFNALRRYLDRLIDPHDNEAPAPDTAISHAPTRLAEKRPPRSLQTCPFR
jgi:hypothetical protein